MTNPSSLDPVFDQLPAQIAQFLLLLSQKEKFVIERRFNLDEKSRATLEEIGQHFKVTRERIRQIEKNGLQKLRRNIENTQLQAINDAVYALLQSSGGLMKEDLLISKLLSKESIFSASAIRLVVSLDKRLERLPNTIYFHPYVRLNTITESLIDDLSRQSANILRRRKDVLPAAQLLTELQKANPSLQGLNKEMLLSLYSINKLFKLLGEQVGLLEWRHIHPRTLRDKIFYTLRSEQAPLHFGEIANRISNSHFDNKRVNLQAVHNELIRCNEFILIGRGIYALKEWGYNNGTVAEVIENILEKKGSLAQDKIVEEVLKQRQVKPITILLNLKNNPNFIRIGRRQYALKKA